MAEIVKKSSKCLYFSVQLKRARLPCTDLVLFYLACVRSILSYAVPVFHHSLSAYLKKDLEHVQKRALSIISPRLSYNDALDAAGIPTI